MRFLDIDECTAGTDNCVNGDCVNSQGSYTCSCNPGWSGMLCDTGKITSFKAVLCLNFLES